MNNTDKSEKQKLIDLTFQIASGLYMNGKSVEEIAVWVVKMLRECGFDTVPIGVSWGVLK